MRREDGDVRIRRRMTRKEHREDVLWADIRGTGDRCNKEWT